ncbi:IclR family transcriptional regulator [Tenacibaculum sp. UWU-22]|uniref:IclR family transcriptional regulator n=1 Tax=Tenacibaculum sp. UWU-22 TaxID=3234187 RepID=UPI0034DAECEB
MEKVKKKNGIQSINVGFSILDVLLKSPKPLPLKEISESSGLSPSKIHSYLVSFLNLGIVEQNTSTGFYSLGNYCLKLGLGYLDQVRLMAVCKPVMEELAHDLGHTVFLGVWGNRGPTIINRVDGAFSQTIFDLRIGSVLPLLTSALGKNFSAYLPETIINPMLIEEIQLNGNNSNFPNGLADIQEMLKNIREKGISQSRGGILSDYTAISVPIFDFSSTIIAGLTIMGRINRLDDRDDGNASKLLKEAGRKISIDRGFTED